ncbi:MAG: prepilin peptidase [Dorea sp.]|nr:prepilin peptidase [Dorea sp.]MDE6830085.1 prepilin peptidase [Lachnospiraceae bacterium]
MWTISRVCCMGFLAWVSVIDLRTRRIPVVLLIVWNLQAVIYRLYQVTGGREDAALFIGGIGVGAAFFLISRVTKEGIGYGDSWMILILGIYLGVWEILEVLAGTCLLLAAASVICLTAKRMSPSFAFPFAPFLAAGYLLHVICAVK